ncbi:hypothetical protein [Mesorhizobium sp. INR15]|uniref:hypothetical protein n=1 Tax=Mesorhizobium sp. INR15 TaxID=2654248 RepID=UPI00189688D2|nr:hypothetical protein [Mesorhizobium sp. INR15]QPC93144.1 hypothetical protein GA829_22670 [Mesorhizobium sp. INR15]
MSVKRVRYYIGVGFRGAIDAGDYAIGRTHVNVSYPDAFMIDSTPFLGRLELPKTSTVFCVSWDDSNGKTQAQFDGHVERQLPLFKALKAINQLTDAFKLVRLGNSEGLHLRRVGTGDTLFHTCLIDGIVDPFVVNRRLGYEPDAKDRAETQDLASSHVAGDTVAIARRYLACFELFDHGYYSEAVIVGHGILDDTIQELINRSLTDKGIDEQEERKLILRGISSDRMKTFLGPLLKLLSGKNLSEIWYDGASALDFLNKKRNAIAHNGVVASPAEAAFCLFASMKIIAVLHHSGLVDAPMPRGMFRTARNLAAWSVPDRPSWVSKPGEEDHDPFDSTYP